MGGGDVTESVVHRGHNQLPADQHATGAPKPWPGLISSKTGLRPGRTPTAICTGTSADLSRNGPNPVSGRRCGDVRHPGPGHSRSHRGMAQGVVRCLGCAGGAVSIEAGEVDARGARSHRWRPYRRCCQAAHAQQRHASVWRASGVLSCRVIVRGPRVRIHDHCCGDRGPRNHARDGGTGLRVNDREPAGLVLSDTSDLR